MFSDDGSAGRPRDITSCRLRLMACRARGSGRQRAVPPPSERGFSSRTITRTAITYSLHVMAGFTNFRVLVIQNAFESIHIGRLLVTSPVQLHRSRFLKLTPCLPAIHPQFAPQEGLFRTGPHRIGQRFGFIEAIIEIDVYAANLESNNGPKRRRIGWEPSVVAKNIIAIRYGRLHRRCARRRYLGRTRSRFAPCTLLRSTSAGSIFPELRLHEGADRILHGLVVGRAEWLQQQLVVLFQPYWIFQHRVFSKPPRESRHQPGRSGVAAGPHGLHAEAGGLEPAVFVPRKIRETAQSKRLGHECKVL